jgi:hypothetical protein
MTRKFRPLLVLAHLYNVDLEQVFIQTMNELEGNLLERQRQLRGQEAIPPDE